MIQGIEQIVQKMVKMYLGEKLLKQEKYGVNFINYWVDEKRGTVLCLSQASDASKVIQTHKEAHGLIPVSVTSVKQGQ